mmetsp:Transcript_29285/g.49212  ORF Transcript_29285/g.49212 Transcript_29285/m.49212 type:complete len:389 (-) Transcript_29285:108-1274(-)
MNQINRRGVEVASFDYAKGLQQMLTPAGDPKYRVRFVTSKDVKDEGDKTFPKVVFKFESNFGPIITYSGALEGGGQRLAAKLRELNCHLFYSLKSGESSFAPYFQPGSLRIPWAVHAVFHTSQPHGTSFAAVSHKLAEDTGLLARCGGNIHTYVDHVVDFPLEELTMDTVKMRHEMRVELGIPHDAKLVLCRHGGPTTFNIDLVRDNLRDVVSRHHGVHVVLMNTDPLAHKHPHIHEIEGTPAVEGKARFFAACDAMLHARGDGETFGLAVAEFALRNKPVITWDGTQAEGYAEAHLEILGDKAYKFRDLVSLERIISDLALNGIPDRDWNAYKLYSREKIIPKFERVFIQPAKDFWAEVEAKGIQDVWSVEPSKLPALKDRCCCRQN